MKIDKAHLLSRLQPEWSEDLLPEIQTAVEQSGVKIVVLDDDPTGTQTVHGVSVLTVWDVASLIEMLRETEPVVYILTNSRSMPLDKAQGLVRELVRNLVSASRSAGRRFSIISRSDSTLRGHFPGEVDAILTELDQEVDGILVIPFFAEGGRLTIGDVHYVEEGSNLVPAGETEFARDASFGYQSSNLRRWVCEKFEQRVDLEAVSSISLELLRGEGPAGVERVLFALKDRAVCVVNAAAYCDLEVFVAGLLRAEAQGKRFIYRTAASFVRVRGGIHPRSLLSASDLDIASGSNRGIILAGSYIHKSTLQIEALRVLDDLISLEVSVPALLDSSQRSSEIQRTASAASRALVSGKDVCIFTSRELVTGVDSRNSLDIGVAVSLALVDILRGIEIRPGWIIAKGGITASDLATQALGIRCARVLGQIAPGVPVWRSMTGSRWSDMAYIVFPGNVGGPQGIAQIVRQLRGVG